MPPELSDRIIIHEWSSPRRVGSGFLVPSSTAYALHEKDLVAVESAIVSLADEGLLARAPNAVQGENAFQTTFITAKERETRLHRLRMRHPALLNQFVADLKDVLLAIAMAPTLWNSRIVGPFLADHDETSIEEFRTYLTQRDVSDIDASLKALQHDGLLDGRTTDLQGRRTEAYRPTIRAHHAYEHTIAGRLGLRRGECILDVGTETSVKIFWAWQSEYKRSRNQIQDALERVIASANLEWSPVRPLQLDQATDAGDGAINISEQLRERIAASDVFVGDLTPVLKHAGRLYPNSNVLIETGYALHAKQHRREVILVEAIRDEASIDGVSPAVCRFPFDIEQIRRIRYQEPKVLREMLSAELKASLSAAGLLLTGAPRP